MVDTTSVIQKEAQAQSADLDTLIERTAMGDTKSFESLYLCLKASVYGYSLSVLKNTQDAEDVLHDCFVNIYQAAPFFKRNGNAKGWVMTIARNLCMQRLRERSRNADVPPEQWELYVEKREGVLPEDKMMLEKCMNLLSSEEREIVVLHVVAGMKHREIAGLLERPLPTVLSKYHRAIKKLRESM